MNTTVYLIRHGYVDNPEGIIYGSTIDVLLTPEGIEQLRKVGVFLKHQNVNPAVIITSPLTRAVQSSNAIAESFPGIEIIQNKDLRDVDAPGLVGFKLAWLDTIGHDVYNYKGREEIGVVETKEHQVKRITGAIMDGVKQYKGKTILIVSHGDPTAFAVWSLLHPGEEIPKTPVLYEKTYLKKGHAWKFVFADDNSLIESEYCSFGLKSIF